jgi:hypothetical protein
MGKEQVLHVHNEVRYSYKHEILPLATIWIALNIIIPNTTKKVGGKNNKLLLLL